MVVAGWALAVVLAIMVAELRRSRANERALRLAGAIEPDGDVYTALAWTYPLLFVAIAIEGATAPAVAGVLSVAGLCVFGAAKALKFWAMGTLGYRWTFRILVLPGRPLVATGPYAWMRHPNYVAVCGELLGMAMTVGAPVTGVLALATFGWLAHRRITVEDHALGRG